MVLQLIPFLYVFAALIKFALRHCRADVTDEEHYFRRGCGLVTTMLAIVVAYFPAKQITSVWKYEFTMFGITFGFIALAVFFFYGYGRLKAPKPVPVKTAPTSSPERAELS